MGLALNYSSSALAADSQVNTFLGRCRKKEVDLG